MPASPANVAALLTPVGRGAIATIGIRGPRSLEFIHRFFLPASGREIEHGAAGAIRVGHWREHLGEEVVISAPSGNIWEVCCHGGHAAAASILDDLNGAGCSVIDWEQWLAVEATDLLEQESRSALARATTARAAGILLDQFDGALARACSEIEHLLSSRHASDDAIEQARARLVRLHAWTRLGERLVTPWRVVVAGAPNVGKSSLLNAIVGYQRSIVYDRPGTTRDAVVVETAIDGWPVQLIDTAGIREATDAIEAAGVERARSHLAHADLVILVAEAGRNESEEEHAKILAEHPHALRVANKCDLLCGSQAGDCDDQKGPALQTSTITGEGIANLIDDIARQLVPEAPLPGEAIPFTARQIDAIGRSLLALEDGDVALAIDAIGLVRRPGS